MRTIANCILGVAAALWLAGCGSGDDASASAKASGLGACGGSCTADVVQLGSDVITIPSADMSYGVMIHQHNALTPDNQNQWMIMVMHNGMMMPNQPIRVNTFSEDCGVPGGQPATQLTTNEAGMVMIQPSFTGSGPWSVRVDPDASSTGDVWEDANDVLIQLCVPNG